MSLSVSAESDISGAKSGFVCPIHQIRTNGWVGCCLCEVIDSQLGGYVTQPATLQCRRMNPVLKHPFWLNDPQACSTTLIVVIFFGIFSGFDQKTKNPETLQFQRFRVLIPWCERGELKPWLWHHVSLPCRKTIEISTFLMCARPPQSLGVTHVCCQMVVSRMKVRAPGIRAIPDSLVWGLWVHGSHMNQLLWVYGSKMLPPQKPSASLRSAFGLPRNDPWSISCCIWLWLDQAWKSGQSLCNRPHNPWNY